MLREDSEMLQESRKFVHRPTIILSALLFCLVTFSQNQQSHQVKIGKYLTIDVSNGEIQWEVEGSPYGWFVVNSEGGGSLYFSGVLTQWLEPEGFIPQWLILTTLMDVLFSFKVDPLIEGMPENFGFVTFGDVWVGVSTVSQQSSARTDGGIREVPSLEVTVVPTESALVAETLEGEIWAHWGDAKVMKGEIVQKELSPSFSHGVELKGATDLDLSAGVNEIDSAGWGDLRVGIVVLSNAKDPDDLSKVIFDPLGVPEVGDNEFVWSSEEPPWLMIPAGAKVVSGFTPDNDMMQWLTEKIDWDVSPPLPSTGLYPRVLPNGYEDKSIFPRYQFHVAPLLEGFLLFDTPEYLPATIGGGFGKRQLVMIFNGQPVHTANIEIFFPATATNHPFFGDMNTGNPPDEGWQFIGNTAVWVVKSPNWFYYYWMVAYFNDFSIRYANSETSFYYNGDQYVHIGNNAYLPYTMRLFRLQGGLITWAETLSIKGIHTFIYAVEHELAHKRHYEIGIYPQTPDNDGDGLSDDWEIAHGLNPTLQDSTGAYRGDPDGDLDCIADIEAYGKLLLKENLWKHDWADTGLQKGPPPFNPMPWRYSSSGTNVSAFNDLLKAIP